MLHGGGTVRRGERIQYIAHFRSPIHLHTICTQTGVISSNRHVFRAVISAQREPRNSALRSVSVSEKTQFFLLDTTEIFSTDYNSYLARPQVRTGRFRRGFPAPSSPRGRVPRHRRGRCRARTGGRSPPRSRYGWICGAASG